MKPISEYGKRYGRNDNYIREDIKELYDDYGDVALIFTCKYYINGNEKYVSVRNVRVFDDNQTKKTKYQLTDHVNFPRKLVEKYIDICEEELRNKKLMMVCTASKYNHYGVERYALKLVTGYSVSPIIRASTVKSKWLEDLERLKELRDSYNIDRAIKTDT